MTLAAGRTLALLSWALTAATMAGVGAFRHNGRGSPLAVIRRGEDGKSYAFGYHVDATPEEDSLFDQFEERLGDRTRGQWRVALPDNRLQVVTYRADEDGFHADISYDYVADLEAAKAIMASDESPWTSHFGVLFRDPDHPEGDGDGDHHGAHGAHGGHGHGHGHGHHHGPGHHHHAAGTGGTGGAGGTGGHDRHASGHPTPRTIPTGHNIDRFNFIPDGTPVMIFQSRKPPSGAPKPRTPTPRPRPSKAPPRPSPRSAPAPTPRPRSSPSKAPPRTPPRGAPSPTPRPRPKAPPRGAPSPTPRPRPRSPPRGAPSPTPRPRPRASVTTPRPSPRRAPSPTPRTRARPSATTPRPSPRAPASTPRPSPAVTTNGAQRNTRRLRPGAGTSSGSAPPVAPPSDPDEEDIKVMPALFVDLTGLTDTPFEHEDVLHRLLSALDLPTGGHAPHRGGSSSGEEDTESKDYAIPNREIVLPRLEAIVHAFPIHLIHA